MAKNDNNDTFSVSFSFDNANIYDDFAVMYRDKVITDRGFTSILSKINSHYRDIEIKNYHKNKTTAIYIKSDSKFQKICNSEIFINLTNKDTKIKTRLFKLTLKPKKYRENIIEVNNYNDYLNYQEILKPIIVAKEFLVENIFRNKDAKRKYSLADIYLKDQKKIFEIIKMTIFDRLSYRRIQEILGIINVKQSFGVQALLHLIGFNKNEKYKKTII